MLTSSNMINNTRNGDVVTSILTIDNVSLSDNGTEYFCFPSSRIESYIGTVLVAGTYMNIYLYVHTYVHMYIHMYVCIYVRMLATYVDMYAYCTYILYIVNDLIHIYVHIYNTYIVHMYSSLV